PISSVASEATGAQASRLHSAGSGVSARQARTLALQSAAPPAALGPHAKPSIQIKVVFQLHVHGHRLSVARRRNESNLPRSHDRFFRQTAAKRLHRANVRNLSRARKDHTQDHRAGNLIATRFFGVLRFRFGNYPRTYVDIRLFEGPINVVVWIVAG